MRAHDPMEEQDEEVELEEVMSELASGQPHEVDEAVDEAQSLPTEVVRYQHVLVSMEQILDGQGVDVEQFDVLTDQERDALMHLTAVVNGVTADNRFIFAEHRLTDLEQVLAVLQPVLAVATVAGAENMRASFDRVVDHIDELRQELLALDDAEEEKLAEDEERDGADGDDQDDPDALEDDLERMKRAHEAAAARAAAARAAPPVPEPGEPPRPSTLAGKANDPAVELPARPSTLAGTPSEPAVELPTRPSTLSDEPAAAKPAPKKR